MPANHFNIKGLTPQQVLEAREKYGYNRLSNGLWQVCKRDRTTPINVLNMCKIRLEN